MKKYDVYGVGNALVDTEYEVDDKFIAATRWQKGIMTLIDASDRAELIHLLEQEHEHEHLTKSEVAVGAGPTGVGPTRKRAPSSERSLKKTLALASHDRQHPGATPNSAVGEPFTRVATSSQTNRSR